MAEPMLGLGLAFALSVATQRITEITGGIFDCLPQELAEKVPLSRQFLLITAATLWGAAASMHGVRLLRDLGFGDGGGLDPLVTALLISGGSETVNTALKYVQYAKQQKHAEAEEKMLGSLQNSKETTA